MKVKDIILTALIYIGRDDVATKIKEYYALKEDGEAVENGEESSAETGGEEIAENLQKNTYTPIYATLSKEECEVLDTVLLCFNAVEDELARFYFPLSTKEKFTSSNGKFSYSDFSNRPIKILSVKSNGKEVKFEAGLKEIITAHTDIQVEYGYAPVKKSLDDDSAYGNEIGERLVSAGVASEYCLINGEAVLANSWEQVYRAEIDRLQRKGVSSVKMPARRWV